MGDLAHKIIAEEYAARGWVPLPVRTPGETFQNGSGQKKSTGKEVRGSWAGIKTPEQGLERFNGVSSNIGIKTGSVSGGLIDIRSRLRRNQPTC